MSNLTTTPASEQPPAWPKVSLRLMVRSRARIDAIRHGVDPAPAVAAAEAAWRQHRTVRAALHAAWAATDAMAGQGGAQ